MVVFGIAALILSIISSDELVLIARVSFAGTSLMAPMVFSAVFSNGKPGIEISIATFIGLLIFIASLFGIVPGMIFGIRLDMLLLVLLGIYAIMSFVVRKMVNQN